MRSEHKFLLVTPYITRLLGLGKGPIDAIQVLEYLLSPVVDQIVAHLTPRCHFTVDKSLLEQKVRTAFRGPESANEKRKARVSSKEGAKKSGFKYSGVLAVPVDGEPRLFKISALIETKVIRKTGCFGVLSGSWTTTSTEVMVGERTRLDELFEQYVHAVFSILCFFFFLLMLTTICA